MEPVSCTETDVSVQSAFRIAQLQSTCEVNVIDLKKKKKASFWHLSLYIFFACQGNWY